MSRRLRGGRTRGRGGVVAPRCSGVEELGAGGVAAVAAVVVGWVPVGQPDEQHSVDGFGDVGVPEPDRLATFLAAGLAASRRPQQQRLRWPPDRHRHPPRPHRTRRPHRRRPPPRASDTPTRPPHPSTPHPGVGPKQSGHRRHQSSAASPALDRSRPPDGHRCRDGPHSHAAAFLFKDGAGNPRDGHAHRYTMTFDADDCPRAQPSLDPGVIPQFEQARAGPVSAMDLVHRCG